jgi:hypothetical protein
LALSWLLVLGQCILITYLTAAVAPSYIYLRVLALCISKSRRDRRLVSSGGGQQIAAVSNCSIGHNMEIPRIVKGERNDNEWSPLLHLTPLIIAIIDITTPNQIKTTQSPLLRKLLLQQLDRFVHYDSPKMASNKKIIIEEVAEVQTSKC